MAEIAHRFVTTNGIKMHYAEAGSGPHVLLCHGAPESWYSWRHQLLALAEAGFHAIAPDMRGYGQTAQPKEVEAYDIFQLTGDLVGLANALGGDPVVIVGHDWGAWITQFAALFRPDLFPAVGLLSVPFLPRLSISPSAWEQEKYPGKIFYQQIFRSPGMEKRMEADVYGTIVNALYSASGEPPVEERWKFAMDPKDMASIGLAPTPKKPTFVTDADIEFLVGEFKRSGFAGCLNYYRNVDRNWALTPFLDGAKLRQPALFIAGDRDGVLGFWGEEVNAMERHVPNLKRKVILPGIGHWTQQESPDAVNRALIEFLRSA
ncbi:MAG TPA: alpha/beta hydrolase [Candidatus Binataceae bacterium]|nr:alpha/beta hydrolase [Candidatus Binataceae bacterium]